MPPLIDKGHYYGAKVLVELNGVVLWGYVMGVSTYFQDIALSYGDYARAEGSTLLSVQIMATLLPEDFMHAASNGLFCSRTFKESEVILLGD